MLTYVARRLAYAVFTLAGVATILFFLLHLTGNPAVLYVPQRASPQAIAAWSASHGFNKPLLVQYATFMASIVRGQFGTSLTFGQPAVGLVLQFFPATLALGTTATVMGLLIGVPVGLVSGTRKGSATDTAAMTSALVGLSLPSFWLALMLILVFGVVLRLLPVAGAGGLSHLILPGLTIAVIIGGDIARMLRSNLIDVLSQDYIRTARALGLRPAGVVFRHALKNALLPTLTVFGLDLAAVISGVYIVEVIFAYPGVGLLTINAINQRDFPVVEASVFLAAVIFVLINLAVDLLYSVLDPRVRLGGRAGENA